VSAAIAHFARRRGGPTFSGIRRATTSADDNVSIAMTKTAARAPKRSAITPDSKAPTVYSESRHNR